MSENNTIMKNIAITNPVSHSVQTVSITVCPEQVPAIDTGDCFYYKNRNTSFIERRGKKKKPPTYYLDYGFKYCSRFKTETYPNLSKQGQKWLDNTLRDLQKYMEKGAVDRAYVSKNNEEYNRRYFLKNIYEGEKIVGVEENVKEFYKGIECREEEFKDFAFATHPDAYNPKELEKLPVLDIMKIGNTPDKFEILDEKTREQVSIMYDKMDVSEIAKRAPKELAIEVSKSTIESANEAKEILIKIFE